MPGDPKTTWRKRKPPGRERKLNGDCQGPGDRELSKVPSTAVRSLSPTTDKVRANERKHRLGSWELLWRHGKMSESISAHLEGG